MYYEMWKCVFPLWYGPVRVTANCQLWPVLELHTCRSSNAHCPSEITRAGCINNQRCLHCTNSTCFPGGAHLGGLPCTQVTPFVSEKISMNRENLVIKREGVGQVYIAVGAEQSSPVNWTSGVPRGSVPGPLLFTMYITSRQRGPSSQSALSSICWRYTAVHGRPTKWWRVLQVSVVVSKTSLAGS